MLSNQFAKFTIALCIIAVVQRSFVEPAPVDSTSRALDDDDEAQIQQKFDEVKQLEDLKHSLGKTFSVLKTHSTVVTSDGGQQAIHAQTTEEVKSDGENLASLKQRLDSSPAHAGHVHTELDIPSRSIHQVVDGPVGETVERRSSPTNDIGNGEKHTSFSGVQYSPLDMAEYVFWTGDEKGVTLAVEEFLQDGMMTREEAISFLQEIKLNLDYLQNHYSQQNRFHKNDDRDKQQRGNREKVGDKSDTKMESKLTNDLIMKKSGTHAPLLTTTQLNQEDRAASISVKQPTQGLSDEDYDELLERLKAADFLYTEYSLEEVIYQLAKVMFSQSLTKGSLEAQEALQKFTSFLEGEAEKGHISRSLEKKVLDVMIASLTDTLSEHPQLLKAAHGSFGDPTATSHPLLPQSNKVQNVEDGHQSTLAKQRDHPTDKPEPTEMDSHAKSI